MNLIRVRRYIVNLVAIGLIVALIFGAINFKNTGKDKFLKKKLNKPLGFVKEAIAVTKHNLTFEFSQKRNKSITLVWQESNLINFSPNLFGNFNRADWDEFWAVIYDPIKEKKGFFKVKRYRTKEEIRDYLIRLYGDALSFNHYSDWQYFWKIVFGEDER